MGHLIDWVNFMGFVKQSFIVLFFLPENTERYPTTTHENLGEIRWEDTKILLAWRSVIINHTYYFQLYVSQENSSSPFIQSCTQKFPDVLL